MPPRHGERAAGHVVALHPLMQSQALVRVGFQDGCRRLLGTAQHSCCEVQSKSAAWVRPLRRRRLRPEHAINTGPPDPEPVCDGCRPELLTMA